MFDKRSHGVDNTGRDTISQDIQRIRNKIVRNMQKTPCNLVGPS